jgi:hypothetical protein
LAELPRRRVRGGRDADPLSSCCGRFRRVGNSLAVPRGLRELVRGNWLGWQTTLPCLGLVQPAGRGSDRCGHGVRSENRSRVLHARTLKPCWRRPRAPQSR